MRFRSIVYPECPLVDAVSPLEAHCDVVRRPEQPTGINNVKAERPIVELKWRPNADFHVPHFLRRPIEHIEITAPDDAA